MRTCLGALSFGSVVGMSAVGLNGTGIRAMRLSGFGFGFASGNGSLRNCPVGGFVQIPYYKEYY